MFKKILLVFALFLFAFTGIYANGNNEKDVIDGSIVTRTLPEINEIKYSSIIGLPETHPGNVYVYNNKSEIIRIYSGHLYVITNPTGNVFNISIYRVKDNKILIRGITISINKVIIEWVYENAQFVEEKYVRQ